MQAFLKAQSSAHCSSSFTSMTCQTNYKTQHFCMHMTPQSSALSETRSLRVTAATSHNEDLKEALGRQVECCVWCTQMQEHHCQQTGQCFCTPLFPSLHGYHSVWSRRSRSTGNLQLTWNHVVDKMAQNTGKCLGLVRRASRFLNPIQRATIYKSMVRSWMKYASSIWMGASATSLGRLDAIQRQAIRIIGLPQQALEARSIQPLDQHRKVGALTLLHQMYYKEAHALLNELVVPPPTFRRSTRQSTSRHACSVSGPVSITTGHATTFLPTSVNVWNNLPEEIVNIKDRQKFKQEVSILSKKKVLRLRTALQ